MSLLVPEVMPQRAQEPFQQPEGPVLGAPLPDSQGLIF